MNLKEKWNSLSKQKQNIIYWASVVFVINVSIAVPKIFHFLQTGQCRNYMQLNSSMQACTVAEFVKYGHGWMTFVNVFALIPAAAVMIFASQIFDVIFSKPKE